MEAKERIPFYYQTSSRASPFRDWRNGIADQNTKAAVDARIARLRGGNFGDSAPVGEGVSENRIDRGPGYRIYYAVSGENIILLCGGDKSTQDVDIRRAHVYWKDYKKCLKMDKAESERSHKKDKQ